MKNWQKVLTVVAFLAMMAGVAFVLIASNSVDAAQHDLDKEQNTFMINEASTTNGSLGDLNAEVNQLYQVVNYQAGQVTSLEQRLDAVDGGKEKYWICSKTFKDVFSIDGNVESQKSATVTSTLWTIGKETPAQMDPGATCKQAPVVTISAYAQYIPIIQ